MARSMLLKAAVFSALFATISSALPSTTFVDKSKGRSLHKRFEEGVDCTSDVVSDNPPGLFFAVDSAGSVVYCDDVDTLVSADNGYSCYRTVERDTELGDLVKCPGDPAPARNPDGSVTTPIGDGLIDSFCKAGGSLPGAPGELATIVGCLLFGYFEANGDPVAEAESGAKGVCDIIFVGACTWFLDVSPALAANMVNPCAEDPESLACTFGGPSK